MIAFGTEFGAPSLWAYRFLLDPDCIDDGVSAASRFGVGSIENLPKLRVFAQLPLQLELDFHHQIPPRVGVVLAIDLHRGRRARTEGLLEGPGKIGGGYGLVDMRGMNC